MITALEIKNFKRLKDTQRLEFAETVVLLGANNSGKTTFLQALSLWHLGLTKWLEKRSGKNSSKRTGVVINRKDILTIPIPHNKMLWSDLYTLQTKRKEGGKIQESKDVNIEISVSGISQGKSWECGLEFEYRDEEVMYVRPLRTMQNNVIIDDPDLLKPIRVFYLPTMSGLKSTEEKLLSQTILARIGEGRTAEVLRNICYLVCNPETAEQSLGRKPAEDWDYITKIFQEVFSVNLKQPELDSRGELHIYFEDHNKNQLEIISAGRGFQQMLLLISCTMLNPNSILLIDEPDAHLEILKQREIYHLLKKITQHKQSQLIIATHSEVLMNEASNTDKIILFYPVGSPKPIDLQSNRTHIVKSLKDYGFTNYLLAERKKFVLYLEGPTDLNMLKSFAHVLNHKSKEVLRETFVHYLNQNYPSLARNHFTALKDAIPDLKGMAIFDRIENPLNKLLDLFEHSWTKRELENYFFRPQLLMRWVESKFSDRNLFNINEINKHLEIMQKAIDNYIPPYALNDPNADYWQDQKASDELDKIFRYYYNELNLPIELSKNKYYSLIELMQPQDIDEEIVAMLNKIEEYNQSNNTQGQ